MSRQLRDDGPDWTVFREIYGTLRYCYMCGKIHDDKNVNIHCNECYESGLMYFLPPNWIPKELYVLTIELFDHVQAIA